MRPFNVGVIAVVMLSLIGRTNGDYIPGFVWNRSVDYDAGTVPGATTGNPSTDSQGNPVWGMESTDIAGDPLGGSNPWYEGTTSRLVWHPGWFGVDGWAGTYPASVGPFIVASAFQHVLAIGGADAGSAHAPIVRWMNPVIEPFDMKIAGTVTTVWDDYGHSSASTDLIICHIDVSTNTTNLLFAQNLVKPGNNRTTSSVDIQGIRVEPGDQLIFSARERQPSGQWYVTFYDDLNLQIIPEPATLSLLALGGAALAARRRRA